MRHQAAQGLVHLEGVVHEVRDAKLRAVDRLVPPP
jgi:hypothetical protein